MTHTLKVGCYGAKGSYTYEAMEQQFGSKEREESYFPLFEDVVKAVKDGTIDYRCSPHREFLDRRHHRSLRPHPEISTVPSSESSW